MAIENVLKNAVDMHIHCAPDTGPRLFLRPWENISPTEGLRCFFHYLVYCGVPADYIHIMVKDNPARLLELT